MTTATIDFLETARWYARGGIHVFPLEGKKPLTENGFKDATTDQEQIEQWAQRHRNANIGIASLLVLDFDRYKPEYAGDDLLDELLEHYPTTTVDTGQGGVHIWYTLSDGIELTNSDKYLPLGVDVRAPWHGYVVAPPSIHPDTGKRYMFRDGLGLHQIEPQPLPQTIVDLLTQQKMHREPKPDTNTHSFTDDIQAATDALSRLSATRADNYESWVNVGMSLTPLGDIGLQLWDEWSQQSGKYEPDVCNKKWPSFNGHGLGLGSLITWANEDSPRVKEAMPVLNWGDAPPADIQVIEDSEPDERNPLDVEVKSDLKLGWIDDCTSFMHELTGSQVNFNRLTALVTAAAAIQRKARVRLSFGPIYPNIFGCVVAPSTSYRKSTAIYQSSKFLHTAMLDNLIIPSHGSTEGLMQQLSETPNALMLRDEIAPLLASDRVKYLKDLKQVLTELYGCEPVKRRLRTEEIKINSPYLSILGATTPEKFYSSTTPGDWADGFLPRFLWALREGDPYWDAMPAMMTVDTIAKMQKMTLQLMNFEKHEEKDFILQGESLSMWSEWSIAGQKAAFAADDENAAAIIGRYATYAMKFALILASVNDSWGIITEETMQTAIHLADNYKAVAYQLLSEADNHKVTGSNIMKVFMVIKRKAGELGCGVTAREIGQYTQLRKRQLTPCLDKLEEIGAVMSKKVGRTKQFVPAIDELQARKWN